ncbi:MAG: TRAP transporter substrate-binding protein [Lachnospiraceae bacterium]|nr:TRAP transporter substrate-binding protein [Lachnospiraceae bacterium]
MKNNMRNIMITMLAAATVMGSAMAVSAEDVTTFRLGHVNGTDSPNQKAADILNELLAEKLPQYQVEIYPSGQLGGERDMIESVQMGTLDMVITATTPLANFVPSLNVGELLYLIQDYDHADAVYHGEIGAQWLEDCGSAGMKGLGFTEVGFRQLCYNSKPIETLADLSGLKLRVMENDMHVNGWKALGCDAVTMGWSDAYAGVQQGTIDAVEVPYSLIYSNSVYDVCKYISETSHIYTAQCMLMSDSAWNTMSEEEQMIFQECATEACVQAKGYARESTENYKEELEAKGMTIVEVDLDSFREAANALYEQYDGEYGEQIAAIQELAK